MATRLRKRPLIDAGRLAAAALRDVNLSIARHVTGCYRCAHAAAAPAGYCDAGWELAKEQARAQAAVRRAADAESSRPVQGTLW